jgi:hypothetical protein
MLKICIMLLQYIIKVEETELKSEFSIEKTEV